MLENFTFWIAIVSWGGFIRLAVYHWKDCAALIRFIDEKDPNIWTTALPSTGWLALRPYQFGKRAWAINRLTFGWVSRERISSETDFKNLVLNARISIFGTLFFLAIALIATAQLPFNIPPPPGASF